MAHGLSIKLKWKYPEPKWRRVSPRQLHLDKARRERKKKYSKKLRNQVMRWYRKQDPNISRTHVLRGIRHQLFGSETEPCPTKSEQNDETTATTTSATEKGDKS